MKSSKNTGRAKALRFMLLHKAPFADEAAAQQARKIAEKPATEWTDSDFDSAWAWLDQSGALTFEREIKYRWDLLLTTLGNLPDTDPLWIEAIAFGNKLFSGEDPEGAMREMERLVQAAKKRVS
jgi:hypothetical protein